MSLDYLLLTLVSLTVFLGATQLAILFLFTRVLGDLKKDHTKNDEFIGEAKKEANTIVGKAMTDAGNIVADAQQSGLKMLSQEKIASTEFMDSFAKSLQNIEAAFREQIGQSAGKADESFVMLTSELEKAIEAHMKENEKVFAEKTDTMVTKTQSLLDSFTSEIQNKVREQVEAEMEAAKKEIAEYKTRRMAVIDERIIDIIEAVMKMVLGKKLTVADQSDLVYTSLEEAKKEHAFSQ